MRVAEGQEVAFLDADGRRHDHALSAHHFALLRPVDAQLLQRQIDLRQRLKMRRIEKLAGVVDSIERKGIVDPKLSDRRPPELFEMRGNSCRGSELMGQRANVGAGGGADAKSNR